VSEQGRKVASEEVETVVSFMERVVGIDGEEPIGKYNRNVLIAATTAIINYGVLASKSLSRTNNACHQRMVKILGRILSEQTDSEVLYRALVGLGMQLVSTETGAKAAGADGWVKAAASRVAEKRVKDIADECLSLS
jgi:phospholipase A-2-activating protein